MATSLSPEDQAALAAQFGMSENPITGQEWPPQDWSQPEQAQESLPSFMQQPGQGILAPEQTPTPLKEPVMPQEPSEATQATQGSPFHINGLGSSLEAPSGMLGAPPAPEAQAQPSFEQKRTEMLAQEPEPVEITDDPYLNAFNHFARGAGIRGLAGHNKALTDHEKKIVESEGLGKAAETLEEYGREEAAVQKAGVEGQTQYHKEFAANQARITPVNNGWENKNAFKKASGYLAAMLGGFLAPYNGGRNMGLEMVMQMIDDDVARQKANNEQLMSKGRMMTEKASEDRIATAQNLQDLNMRKAGALKGVLTAMDAKMAGVAAGDALNNWQDLRGNLEQEIAKFEMAGGEAMYKRAADLQRVAIAQAKASRGSGAGSPGQAKVDAKRFQYINENGIHPDSGIYFKGPNGEQQPFVVRSDKFNAGTQERIAKNTKVMGALKAAKEINFSRTGRAFSPSQVTQIVSAVALGGDVTDAAGVKGTDIDMQKRLMAIFGYDGEAGQKFADWLSRVSGPEIQQAMARSQTLINKALKVDLAGVREPLDQTGAVDRREIVIDIPTDVEMAKLFANSKDTSEGAKKLPELLEESKAVMRKSGPGVENTGSREEARLLTQELAKSAQSPGEAKRALEAIDGLSISWSLKPRELFMGDKDPRKILQDIIDRPAKDKAAKAKSAEEAKAARDEAATRPRFSIGND